MTITATQLREPRYKGLFPVVPTTFTEDGTPDIDSQKRCVDFMIDASSSGLCILANFSEQFLLSDDEREILTRSILGHFGGRVPVIVTTTHFSTTICVDRSRRAQELGAALTLVEWPRSASGRRKESRTLIGTAIART